MKLEIILRTHDSSNVHTDRVRYCGGDKKTLVIKSAASLINSAKIVKNHTIDLVVLDDHSSESTVEELKKILDSSGLINTFISLDQRGYNHSALKQFERCRDSAADLVYSVEDDYLHCPTSLQEMLDSYEIFQSKLPKPVAIYPFDMPDDYVPPWMESCYVVHGSARHWRTGAWTTNTVMTTPAVFQQHWPTFEKFATKYNGDYSKPRTEHVDESNTVCLIWRNHVIRFSPIPSLALHVQFDTQIDPYIDWNYWWEHYTKY
jgi:hypothetical protein